MNAEVSRTSIQEYIAVAVALGIMYFFHYFVRNKIVESKLTDVFLPYASDIHEVSKSFSSREFEVILNPEFKLKRLLIKLEDQTAFSTSPGFGPIAYVIHSTAYSELPGDFRLFIYMRVFVNLLKDKFKGLEEVSMNVPVFDSKYAVFTNDVSLASYILSDEKLRSYLLSGLVFNALEVTPEDTLKFSILTEQTSRHALNAFHILERIAELIYTQLVS